MDKFKAGECVYIVTKCRVPVTTVSMETQRNNAPFVLFTYILRC